MKQAEFFDSYADKWDSMERPDMPQLVERVVKLAGVMPGMCVLDVGTGTGVLIPPLLSALRGSGRIRAIDISREMIRVAKSKFVSSAVEFDVVGLEDCELPAGSFDRVICNAVFPHFEDKPAALARVYEILKTGGWIVISHPTGREAVNKVHKETGSVVAEDRVPSAETMRVMLKAAGFSNVSVIDDPEFYFAKGEKLE